MPLLASHGHTRDEPSSRPPHGVAPLIRPPPPFPPSGGEAPVPAPPPARRLLAIDAGLRAGIAVYGGDGRLQLYRSTNFGAPKRLRSAVHGVMAGIPGLERVVVEGGGNVAEPWLREAERRRLWSTLVQAGEWRRLLLLSRDRRTGSDAKEQADVLARRVIEWSEVPRPTSLRHDAAEAILIGLWAVLEAGWLPALPPELRPGWGG